jgi:hypothetical protein
MRMVAASAADGSHTIVNDASAYDSASVRLIDMAGLLESA